MTAVRTTLATPLEVPQSVRSPFSRQDLAQIKDLGRDPNEVLQEIGILRRGSAPLNLLRSCSVSDGIRRLSQSEQLAALKRFERLGPGRRVTKFVTASGSASRMFQALTAPALRTRDEAQVVAAFQQRLQDFAFFPLLQDALVRQGQGIELLRKDENWRAIVACLLDKPGLGYRHTSKALIPFHAYPDGTRTALEEHLVEASSYAADPGGVVDVHFTVATPQRSAVQAHLTAASRRFQRMGLRFNTHLSDQRESTHTVSLDSNHQIVRSAEGRILFKPAGHGAVLPNLNDLAGDVVFVRTIDNVLPDCFRPFVCFYKKVIGGVLLALEDEIHRRLERLQNDALRPQFLDDTARFVESQLSMPLPVDWPERVPQERRQSLIYRLNRPLRVCAVVPNDGKPGGAPFWIQNRAGSKQLRIVDSPEVDLVSEEQRQIWGSAPYFNPADMVCSLRSWSGNPFNLHAHQDPTAWMVVTRSENGRVIRNLERPGLWNGGMADWNTVFVEVPKATCRPVKTVADLLELPKLPSP